MKKLITLGAVSVLIGSFLISSAVEAAIRVRGGFRSNGTYVQPHYRSSPNSSRFDNYSARGNYNPYTGKKGYSKPYKW